MSFQSNDNPFDKNSLQTVPETPKLMQLIKAEIANGARHLRVCLPCVVTAVHGEQTVDVQPTLQAQWVRDTSPQNLPELPNLPVLMPMGADWSVKFPIAVGDLGAILVADRSMDVWSASNGGIVNPNDPRHHELADAIYLPGLYPSAKQTTDGTSDLVLKNGSATVALEKSGKVRLSNPQHELVDLTSQLADTLSSFLQTLSATMVTTAFGPAPFTASGVQGILSTKSQLDQLKSFLDTLKG